ncbi:uncharacterized protein LOC110007857 [Amborella trichopoda]|uniref:uncharacterized protein LOC110007857 n=1 Tax=Amborella trichopoda TaxID=13333 RepID=UPI0009C04F8D|nr:uncharacterized protein LOC110007857 [Amborella trichopoda]|eukprot:XP_020527272.1 uncharacterized protein LOC110007857 [Amborella trichopoda]
MGLNDSCELVRANILLMEPLPPVFKAYSLVLQEERQRDIHLIAPNTEAVAFVITKQSSSKKGGTRPPLHYDFCHKDNHTKDRCYKLIGYPKRLPKPHANNMQATPSQLSLPSGSQFTIEQHRQLLDLLQAGSSNHLANLAGPVNEEDD